MDYTVLIVDDSKLARMSVAKLLNGLRPDWKRLEAADADSALAAARQAHVNIAFIDFNMPGRDGLVLAAELRAIDDKLAIAIVSANHQAEVVNRAKELDATFLVKPLNEQALRGYLGEAELRLKEAGA